MTNKQILELAKSHKFDEFVGEKDDETDGVYWQCWEEQLIEFARAIYEQGKEDGYSNGYDSAYYEHSGY
jgi:hypothetical protein